MVVAALGHSWKQGLVGLGHRQELVLCICILLYIYRLRSFSVYVQVMLWRKYYKVIFLGNMTYFLNI